MKIKTVQVSFTDTYDNCKEEIAVIAEVSMDKNISKVVQELRDSLSDSTTTTYKFYSRKLEAQEESTKIIEQLARLRKEWELTSEFLRAQGINPECPSMPFFDKLLSAAKNEEEIEAEFEDDDNDDYEEDEE